MSRTPTVAAATIPPGVVVDGTIVDRGIVVSVVARLLGELGVAPGSAGAVLVPSRFGCVRHLRIPGELGEDPSAAFSFEASQLLPESPEEIAYDVHPLGQGPTGEHDAILVTAGRQAVLDRARLLEDAGLAPARVDLDAVACVNACDDPSLRAGTTVVAVVGFEGVVSVVTVGGCPRLSLALARGGGRDLERCLLEAGLGGNRVRDLVRGSDPKNAEEASALADAVASSAVQISDGIRRTLELARCGENGVDVRLAGGASLARGLRAALDTRFDGSVVYAAPGRWHAVSAVPDLLAPVVVPVVGLARSCAA